GAVAMYFTGMGADSDPAPRGRMLHAKRHGLELAGTVIGVLGRPMGPVRGEFKLTYAEVAVPLTEPPSQEQIEKDASNPDINVKARASFYLDLLKTGKPAPDSVTLPVGVLRFGKDLTIVFVAGEVVVDYARRVKRLLGPERVWTVGYAYEVPCY